MSKPQTTFSNLLSKLQGLNLKQTGYWVDDLPEDIYENFFYDSNYEVVARDLDLDRHRWYEISTEVIKIHGSFLGIRQVTHIKNENDSVGDTSFVYQFFEMREKTVTSYEKVPNIAQ
jgi:hypothetical protein